MKDETDSAKHISIGFDTAELPRVQKVNFRKKKKSYFDFGKNST